MEISLVIVDDAPFIREIVRQTVSQANIEVLGEATNGKEALTIVLEKKPQVVLMDIVMPQMSGIESTKEILAKYPEVKIIACSTIDQEAIVLKALDAGCCDYIVKPFKRDDLINAIKSAVTKEEEI